MAAATAAAAAATAGAKPRARTRWVRLRRDKVLLLMMLPGVLYFVVFHYLAQLGNIIAFKDYVPFVGMWDSPWVGLPHSRRCSPTPTSGTRSATPVELALLQLVFFFPVPLALAMLLHSLTRNWVRKFVQSVSSTCRTSSPG